MGLIRDVIDSTLRTLGTHARIEELGRLENAVMQSLRSTYAGQQVKVYVPMVGSAVRAERARSIREQLAAGKDVAMLSREHGLSQRQVVRIARGRR